jgi:hypothetical protein
MKKTLPHQGLLNHNSAPSSAHDTPTSPTVASTTIDPIHILERIESWPANSNSDPEVMADALDQIQRLSADAVRSLRSQQALLAHRPIIAGEDRFGPFLMFGEFRSAMPSNQAAHLISQLLNKQSYCGQPDCPCGPVDPPHEADFSCNATPLPWDYGVTNDGIPYIRQMGGIDIVRFELSSSRPQQQQIANAMLAVHAVNSHTALVTALRENVAKLEPLRDLVSRAFDRFTDNDMQPPNAVLAKWLDDAKEALT